MQIGTFEAKNRFSALLDLVEAGQEVTITRNGKPVARSMPR
jgi:prevent-host-death family protein